MQISCHVCYYLFISLWCPFLRTPCAAIYPLEWISLSLFLSLNLGELEPRIGWGKVAEYMQLTAPKTINVIPASVLQCFAIWWNSRLLPSSRVNFFRFNWNIHFSIARLNKYFVSNVLSWLLLFNIWQRQIIVPRLILDRLSRWKREMESKAFKSRNYVTKSLLQGSSRVCREGKVFFSEGPRFYLFSRTF